MTFRCPQARARLIGPEFPKARYFLRIVGGLRICEFRHINNGLIPAAKRGAHPAHLTGFRECEQMRMTSFAVAELGSDDRDYDNWLTTLTQASARLDLLQTVVNELCQLCEKEDVVRSQQVLEVLERHGAITKAAAADSDAA